MLVVLSSALVRGTFGPLSIWSTRVITACWERGQDKVDSTVMTSDGDTRALNFEMALTK